MSRAALTAAETFLRGDLAACIATSIREEFHIRQPKAVHRDVLSGDRFFANSRDLEELRSRFPSAACVEMEGAAVAQVCHEYGIPCAIIRTISDTAGDHAAAHFSRFLTQVAGPYGHGILRRLVSGMRVVGESES
jgi:adenosylhomocysteine nucleosidase